MTQSLVPCPSKGACGTSRHRRGSEAYGNCLINAALRGSERSASSVAPPSPQGRKMTRRLKNPGIYRSQARHDPGALATKFVEAHDAALRSYGSDSGAQFGFSVKDQEIVQVHFPDEEGFSGWSSDVVVTEAAWGRIDIEDTQALLEGDAWINEDGTTRLDD